MKSAFRRQFVLTGVFSAIALGAARAFAALSEPSGETCLVKASEFSTESVESPFFEHYHQLAIPVSGLFDPPKDGIVVKSSAVDQGSYDLAAFKKFIKSSGLNEKALRTHSHEVRITRDELERIAKGEKDVEIRVISAKGNYVHNFYVTAPPSALVKVRKQLSQSIL